MAHTIESAFKHEHIHEVFQFLSEYYFQVGDLETWITVRHYRKVGEDGVWFRQSHYIKTPKQGGPYRTSRPYNDTEELAIHQVVGAINLEYSGAVKAGCKPEESWLVRNEHFNEARF